MFYTVLENGFVEFFNGKSQTLFVNPQRDFLQHWSRQKNGTNLLSSVFQYEVKLKNVLNLRWSILIEEGLSLYNTRGYYGDYGLQSS